MSYWRSSIFLRKSNFLKEINIILFITGVDPKSVFCAFFKQGLCKKGEKCKFSHDPAVERKSAKRNLYADEKEKDENMEDWDDDKLADVVNKKHGAEKTNQTDIVSFKKNLLRLSVSFFKIILISDLQILS